MFFDNSFCDSLGRVTLVADGNGAGRRLAFDGLGRVTAVYNELSQAVTYEYDLAGRRTALVDAKGNRTVFLFFMFKMKMNRHPKSLCRRYSILFLFLFSSIHVFAGEPTASLPVPYFELHLQEKPTNVIIASMPFIPRDIRTFISDSFTKDYIFFDMSPSCFSRRSQWVIWNEDDNKTRNHIEKHIKHTRTNSLFPDGAWTCTVPGRKWSITTDISPAFAVDALAYAHKVEKALSRLLILLGANKHEMKFDIPLNVIAFQSVEDFKKNKYHIPQPTG